MKKCSICSATINDSCKFCTECGAKSETEAGERVREFSGKITKCPNCGEVLKALSTRCPACGFELREVGNTSSVKEFSEQLSKTVSVNQKISLIRNFPIPNAKADVFEFLILATSNFETSKYMKATGRERAMEEAWLGKMEQAYRKAEALFGDDRDFVKYKELYEADINELAAAMEAKAGAKHYVFGTIMMLCAAFLLLVIMLKGSGIAANPRLDVTVLGFFANGIVSYLYASRKKLKLVALLAYSLNAALNVGFCLAAPGHVFHVVLIVACGLGALIDKKN